MRFRSLSQMNFGFITLCKWDIFFWETKHLKGKKFKTKLFEENRNYFWGLRFLLYWHRISIISVRNDQVV